MGVNLTATEAIERKRQFYKERTTCGGRVNDCLEPVIDKMLEVLNMGVRENKVEKHLNDQVCLHGGITRKWTSPGRDGVPDRIVIIHGDVYFCEVKTADGKLSSAQKREHERLRMHGAHVWTLYGQQGVDDFVRNVF